jgi:hypothetical protein
MVRPWRKTLLEFIIANPRASGAETAAHFKSRKRGSRLSRTQMLSRALGCGREAFLRVSASLVEKLVLLLKSQSMP